ncbi:MAG: hypothetical protein IJZ46_02660 [Bacilli bacterium]|nr:hypothetical protein [Bacilli bacterium]
MNEVDAIIKKYFNNDREIIEQNIQESFPQIIETFISFYGEGYRSKIENVFSRTKIFVAPQNITEITEQVEKMNKEIYDYLYNKYEEYRNFFSFNQSVNSIQFASYEFNSLPEDIRNEMEQIEEKLKQYENLYCSYTALSNKLYEKYDKLSYEKASNDIKEILKNELNYPDEILNNINFEKQNYISIDSLEELQENIATDNMNKYINSLFIIVNFLNNLGIEKPKMKALDFSSNYTEDDYKKDIEIFEEFLNTEYYGRKVKDYVPNRNICGKIKNKWELIYQKCFHDEKKEFMEKLYGDKYFLSNYLGYEPSLCMLNGVAGTAQPFLIKEENETRLGNVVCLYPCRYSRNLNVSNAGEVLIHELNHALESCAKYTENGTYIVASGWDILDERNSKTHDAIPDDNKHAIRNYELMNEVINDFITLELFEIIKGKSSSQIFKRNFNAEFDYSNAFFILDDFYKIYKDKIIQSRQQNNFEIMYEAVGKDNFIALANLLREFSNCHYNGMFKYNKAIQEREAGIQSEMTRMLDEAEKRRDEIMVSMMTYSNNSHKARGIIDIKILIIIIMIIVFIFLIILGFKL